MATGDGQPKDVRREAAITFQVKSEGISSDYLNPFTIPLMQCKALSGEFEKNFPLKHYSKAGNKGEQITEIKQKLLKSLQGFHTYTEYMGRGGENNKIDGFALEDFLTERGKEIVVRLDEIVVELKSLIVSDLEDLDVKKILSLLTELHDLIDNQASFR